MKSVFLYSLATGIAVLPLGSLTSCHDSSNQAGKTKQAVSDPAVKSAEDLVARITPSAKGLVQFKLNAAQKDTTVAGTGKGIIITAPSIRECIRGYGRYLRDIAGVHLSWNGDRIKLPETLPQPKGTVHFDKEWPVCHAYNYCTLSYTYPFNSWQQWERELDFLALNGFSQVLVTAGLEKTWQQFLTGLGYPQDKALAFIPNPAFAAWWNMGNLEGHGGPISQGVIDREAELGRNIVSRLKEMGMTPVLQGYVGFLPDDFGKTVADKEMNIVPQGGWCSFNRPAVLDPTCAAFPRIAEAWYKALHKTYGTTTTAYGGDLFHEGGRSGNINVTNAAKAVQAAMTKASPDSTWVIQAWGGNPSGALLDGTDPGKTQVLALTLNMTPADKATRNFKGRPYVWCELANFGGNTGLYGGLPLLSGMDKSLNEAKKTGLIGMGILSEGVATNPLHYDMFFERIGRTDHIDIPAFLKGYAERRYGSAPKEILEGLQLLADSIYAPNRAQEGCTESIICGRPFWGIRKASTWSSAGRSYDFRKVLAAARAYMKAIELHPELMKEPTFRYDFVDLMRQILTDSAYEQLQIVREAFDSKDVEAYKKESAKFLQLMEDADDILATEPQFLLGRWIQDARNKGKTPEEKDNMERAAKMLISTWSNSISGLNDYSNRQWAGFIRDFYLPRWQLFFDSQLRILQGTDAGKANKDYQDAVHKHELGFSGERKAYPVTPKGDAAALAAKAFVHHDALFKSIEMSSGNVEGLPWNLESGSPLNFNVTEYIKKPGTYTARFTWNKGQSALKIHSVALYEGDKLVAEDKHEGWTGQDNRDNVYTLKLPSYRTNLDAYTLKAEVSGASGTQSQGTMSIRFTGK